MIKKLTLCLCSLILGSLMTQYLFASTIFDNIAGKILLQTEDNGEAWYIDPDTHERYYIKNGIEAYNIMRKKGIGINNSNLASIPIANDSKIPDFTKNWYTNSLIDDLRFQYPDNLTLSLHTTIKPDCLHATNCQESLYFIPNNNQPENAFAPDILVQQVQELYPITYNLDDADYIYKLDLIKGNLYIKNVVENFDLDPDTIRYAAILEKPYESYYYRIDMSYPAFSYIPDYPDPANYFEEFLATFTIKSQYACN